MAELAADGSPPLLLVANDDEWASRSLESVLGPLRATFERVFTGRGAVERALVLQPDAVLVSSILPDMPAAEVVRELRSHPRFPLSIPMLVTAATPSRRSERLEALAAGAWDCLTLPTDAELLVLRLRNYVAARRAAAEGWEASRLVTAVAPGAERDLELRLRALVDGAARHGTPLACAVLEPGDAAPADASVELLGALLRRVGRRSDTIARTGATRFVVLAPRTGLTGLQRMLERVSSAFEASVVALSGAAEPPGLRVGYAVADSGRALGVDPRALLRRAEGALSEPRPWGGGLGAAS